MMILDDQEIMSVQRQSIQIINVKQKQQRSSILNKNKIVVFCHKYVFIIDNDLVIIQTLNHNLQECGVFKTRQLNSLNYVIVQGESKYSIQFYR
ncbi:hypothetical protein pb186bvf_020539 [Paramecium bursaria]